MSFAFLLLMLASSARTQGEVVDPKALAPIGLPSLLIGSPSAPAPVLSAALSAQSAAIASLPAPAAVSYLAARAASDQPAERAAAKIAAARLAASEKGASDARLRALADSAKADPALAAWFDGAARDDVPAETVNVRRQIGIKRRTPARARPTRLSWPPASARPCA